MKVLIILLCLFSFIGCTMQPKKHLDKSLIKTSALPSIVTFFKLLSSGKTDTAVLQLLSSNENISIEDSATINIKDKLRLISSSSGRFIDYKLLREKAVDDCIEMYSYIARYEKKYYRFIFEFYNNGESVKIYKLLFDENIDYELEESLKFYAN
jgi:hypothetical protein